MKKNYLKVYEKHLIYLRDNIPPDDIYAFSLQLLHSSQHFLKIISEKMDIDELAEKNIFFDRWARNIISLSYAIEKDIKVKLDLTLYEESDFK